MNRPARSVMWCVLMVALAPLSGCQSTYYAAMEKIGYEKREILVNRVEDARDEQAEAKEEFQSALEEFTALVNFDGGELEKLYNRLSDQLEDCEDQADDVRDKVDSVESVAAALFKEWEAELDEYSSADLRRRSEQQLNDTKSHYNQLIAAMKAAESKMDPVLTALNDQVLFLKHNLNAQAIASLEGTTAELESDVARLIEEMEAAIAEADAFIGLMGT